jgi:hypothetical protein
MTPALTGREEAEYLNWRGAPYAHVVAYHEHRRAAHIAKRAAA